MMRPGARLLILTATSSAIVVVAPTANAGLIPPPAVWPAPVTGATNPLTGSGLIYNGTHAGPATVNLWLRDHGRDRNTVTRSTGGTVTVQGMLENAWIDDGPNAIGGATVTIATQSPGGVWTAVATVHTTASGRFGARLPVVGHARVAALYWPLVDSPTPVYSRRLLVRAKGRVWLARPFHRGQRYRLDGHVTGAPIPPGGLLVALQVRNSSRRWITARLARTQDTGQFRVRYRFPPGRFAVRILTPSQPSWPLYGSTSRRRTIRDG